MTHYSIESITRNYVTGYEILSFPRNISNKYRKQLLDTGVNASRKVIHKAANGTGKSLGNKIADTMTKSNDDKIMKTKHEIDGNLRNVQHTIIPPEKIKKINKLRQVLQAWSVIKYLSY